MCTEPKVNNHRQGKIRQRSHTETGTHIASHRTQRSSRYAIHNINADPTSNNSNLNDPNDDAISDLGPDTTQNQSCETTSKETIDRTIIQSSSRNVETAVTKCYSDGKQVNEELKQKEQSFETHSNSPILNSQEPLSKTIPLTTGRFVNEDIQEYEQTTPAQEPGHTDHSQTEHSVYRDPPYYGQHIFQGTSVIAQTSRYIEADYGQDQSHLRKEFQSSSQTQSPIQTRVPCRTQSESVKPEPAEYQGTVSTSSTISSESAAVTDGPWNAYTQSYPDYPCPSYFEYSRQYDINRAYQDPNRTHTDPMLPRPTDLEDLQNYEEQAYSGTSYAYTGYQESSKETAHQPLQGRAGVVTTSRISSDSILTKSPASKRKCIPQGNK